MESDCKRFDLRWSNLFFIARVLMTTGTTRREEDLLGALEIPADAYWGVHTGRAIKNFPLSGRRVRPSLIRAICLVKKACASANGELGYLAPEKAEAIIAACDEICAGLLTDQFPLAALQGGAGTSTNMNCNEVIANRAAEILGGRRGDYDLVHPLDHVNLHQSTNDVYPTAVKIAAIRGLEQLAAAIASLQGALQEKERAFGGIVAIGRTELQEAVPMTLGAQFSAFAEAVGRDRWRTDKARERLRVVNLGGTAVGTGIAAPRDYIFLVIEKLREVTALGLSRGENLAGETANADPYVEVSGILKAHAANLVKIAGDLRLLNFTGEVLLPAVQAGSSIMPGKVNPVVAEAVIQAGLAAMADDLLVAEAASRGTFQINEFLPLLAEALLDELELLCTADLLLRGQIEGLAADEKRCRAFFEQSAMIATALVPYIGYDRAAALVREYQERLAAAEAGEGAEGRGNRNAENSASSGERGAGMRSFLEEKLGEELVSQALAPHRLVQLGYAPHG